ncbi:MAG TPA: hypothetical protein VFZ34_08015 [Blastocatellia bacterium]|nr:hypothetical protein [Blastocatellia bacterium]
MKKLFLVLLVLFSLQNTAIAQARPTTGKSKQAQSESENTSTSPIRKTAAQIAATQPGELGREYWQTDGMPGLYRDFGSAVGIQRVNACISPYDIRLVPNDSRAATRTANSAQWAAWMAALSPKGACIQFPEAEFYFQTSLTFTKPIKLLGAGTRFVAGEAPTGTALIVESGQNGITVAGGAKNSTIQGVLLKTRTGNSVPTGDGIHAGATVRIEQVVIESFGRDGIFFNGTAPANTDFSSVSDSHTWYVRRDGLHLDGGGDTNVISINTFNATNSGRYGVYNAGASNVLSNVHVAFAGVVTKGSAAYYDAGSSNIYLNPYSEDREKFFFGPGSNYNTVICGLFGTPIFDATAPGFHGGHTVLERGAYRGLRLRDLTENASGHHYSLQAANYKYPGEVRLHDETARRDVFSYEPGANTLHVPALTATAAKIGVSGTTVSYATHGAGTLKAGTVTIVNPNITANSRVLVTRTSKGAGVLYVSTKTAGVSFTVSSSEGTDGGTFDYWIVN